MFSTLITAVALTATSQANVFNQQAIAQNSTQSTASPERPGVRQALKQLVQERASSAKAMDMLGKPQHLRQQENQVGNVTEVLTELTYEKSTLVFVKSSLGEQERLVYFKTHHEDYEDHAGVEVGDSLEEAKASLPRLQPVEAYTYQQCDPFGRGDCVRLQIHEGEVAQVERMFVMD